MSDLFLPLKCDSPLDSIDNFFERPLVALHTIGSLLFAEDEGIPSFFHTAPNFMLSGRHYSIVEKGDRLKSQRPLTQINDDLVTLMKKPIDLPDENIPNHATSDHGRRPDVASPSSSRHRHSSSAVGKHHDRSLHDPRGVHNGGSDHSTGHSKLNVDRRPRSSGPAKPQSQPVYVASLASLPYLPPLSSSHPMYPTLKA
ncbi:hypothetical protein C0991_010680 [Blastosporella zonata]|nr:hypothetical protein C0991_010680 [Blastosporella zonata]